MGRVESYFGAFYPGTRLKGYNNSVNLRQLREEKGVKMSTIINIAGMSCNHCKMAVEKALKAVPGVKSAQVDLEKGQAVIEGAPQRENLVKAIEEAGYEVVSQ